MTHERDTVSHSRVYVYEPVVHIYDYTVEQSNMTCFETDKELERVLCKGDP